jgi:hypothetical protein
MSIMIIAARTSSGLPRNCSVKDSSAAWTDLINANKRSNV